VNRKLPSEYELVEEKVMAQLIIKEGFLTKQGAVVKNWKRRWFVLTEGNLHYRKKKEDTIPAGIIRLWGCNVDEVQNYSHPYCFSIQPNDGGRTYYLLAESPQSRDDWINLLRIYCVVQLEDSYETHKASQYSPKESINIHTLLQELQQTVSQSEREQLLRNVTKVYCKDISQILLMFSSTERVSAIRILSTRIVDPENAAKAVGFLPSEQERIQLVNELRVT